MHAESPYDLSGHESNIQKLVSDPSKEELISDRIDRIRRSFGIPTLDQVEHDTQLLGNELRKAQNTSGLDATVEVAYRHIVPEEQPLNELDEKRFRYILHEGLKAFTLASVRQTMLFGEPQVPTMTHAVMVSSYANKFNVPKQYRLALYSWLFLHDHGEDTPDLELAGTKMKRPDVIIKNAVDRFPFLKGAQKEWFIDYTLKPVHYVTRSSNFYGGEFQRVFLEEDATLALLTMMGKAGADRASQNPLKPMEHFKDPKRIKEDVKSFLVNEVLRTLRISQPVQELEDSALRAEYGNLLSLYLEVARHEQQLYDRLASTSSPVRKRADRIRQASYSYVASGQMDNQTPHQYRSRIGTEESFDGTLSDSFTMMLPSMAELRELGNRRGRAYVRELLAQASAFTLQDVDQSLRYRDLLRGHRNRQKSIQRRLKNPLWAFTAVRGLQKKLQISILDPRHLTFHELAPGWADAIAGTDTDDDANQRQIITTF